jgi:hypothetical protein
VLFGTSRATLQAPGEAEQHINSAATYPSLCTRVHKEGKGKLERWHRTCRDQFLSEIDERHITSIDDLNVRFWAWVEAVYHRTPHAGLSGQTPLERYQQDLPKIRTLGPRAAQIDALFLHRIKRLVRKDGTVSYLSQRFEVPYELTGKTVQLVVDPHAHTVLGVEDDKGNAIGPATPLDTIANANRTRHKPAPVEPPTLGARTGPNLVELTYQQYHDLEKE